MNTTLHTTTNATSSILSATVSFATTQSIIVNSLSDEIVPVR
jgi:hypothetical protein